MSLVGRSRRSKYSSKYRSRSHVESPVIVFGVMSVVFILALWSGHAIDAKRSLLGDANLSADAKASFSMMPQKLKQTHTGTSILGNAITDTPVFNPGAFQPSANYTFAGSDLSGLLAIDQIFIPSRTKGFVLQNIDIDSDWHQPGAFVEVGFGAGEFGRYGLLLSDAAVTLSYFVKGKDNLVLKKIKLAEGTNSALHLELSAGNIIATQDGNKLFTFEGVQSFSGEVRLATNLPRSQIRKIEISGSNGAETFSGGL